MNKYMRLFLIVLVMLTNFSYAVAREKAGYQTITTDSYKPFRAYVAGPQEAKQGLLLLHGWLGLNREMEIWANQFAVQGYRVMAVDLYDSQVTKNPATARKLMNSINQDAANEKFQTAIKILSQNGRKIAVLGRSFGANQSIYAASSSHNAISAVILYYPFGDAIATNDSLASITAPVLGIFASEDIFFDKDRQQKFISVAESKGINLRVEHYPARHGFTNILGKNFDVKADRLSLNTAFSFLKEHLH